MESKYRHEYKYLITSTQAELVSNRLNGFMRIDNHTTKGVYTISSLYFDDDNNTCFYENENGTEPREKYRVRIYNHSSEIIKLESKRKQNGKTYKKTYTINRKIFDSLVNNNINLNEEYDKSLEEILSKIKLKNMKPKVIVEYERIPFVYKEGNVRVTIDKFLSSSNETTKFLDGNYSKRPVMPSDLYLLEVKFDEYIPIGVYNACQINNISTVAYSKYYLCRKYHL